MIFKNGLKITLEQITQIVEKFLIPSHYHKYTPNMRLVVYLFI